VLADEIERIDQQPHLAGDEGAERESFLVAVKRDLEDLRQEVRRHEKPRQRLVEAAPFIYAALKDGVRKEAILRVLARRGYTGTRAMFLYFLKKHLDRELIKQGITPEGWSKREIDAGEGQPRAVLKREPGKKRLSNPERRRQTVQKLAAQRAAAESTVKVFKEGSKKEETEFDRRLGEAIKQRKQRGDWEDV
jgi:hypothetical protein